MKAWTVDYISKNDNDVAHAWCYAETKEEAERYIRGEFWDIKEVIQVRENKRMSKN